MARTARGLGPALMLVALGVWACGSSSAATPSPTSAVTTAAPSASATASPTATASPSLGTPAPTSGAAGAYRTVQSYVGSLLAARYEDAWNLLGLGCQARWGSLAAFTKDRAAFLKQAGTDFKLQISPSNTLSLSSWIVGTSWAPKIDQANAFLFSLRWAGFGTDPRGTEIWIANPTMIGWDLYLAN